MQKNLYLLNSLEDDKQLIRVVFLDGREQIYEYQTMDDLREMLANDGKITLDHCYIREFSYTELYDERNDHNLNIEGFSAVSAFFDGETDFSGVTFDTIANFDSATFDGEVDFSGASFNDIAHFCEVTFDGEADFNRVTFCSKSDFRSVTFCNVTIFNEVSFLGKTSFELATFNGKVDFKDATFYDKVGFICAKFDNTADFYRVLFKGKSYYRGVDFSAAVNFTAATFCSKVYFEYVTFKEAYFDVIIGNAQIQFGGCTFKDKISFNGISADTLIFDHCENHQKMDMHVEPKKIECLAFKYMDNQGRIEINWQGFKDALQKFDSRDQDYDYRIYQFKMLRDNYQNLGEYDRADECFLAYKKIERERSRGFRKFWSFLSDFIVGYGVKPLRLVRLMFIVILTFSILYCYIFPEIELMVNENPTSYINVLLYSVGAFFNIQFGSLSFVSAHAPILVGSEGLIGIFVMVLFSIAAGNKFMR